MKQYREHKLDRIDKMLIREMEADGRQSVSQLARRTNVTLAIAARKVRKLLDWQVARVSVVAAPPSLGYDVVTVIGIKARQSEILAIADKLAASRSILWVAATCAGRYSMYVLNVCREQSELNVFLGTLKEMPGVIEVECTTITQLRKLYGWDIAREEHGCPRQVEETPSSCRSTLQIIDLRLIRELEVNGRQTTTDLAKKLGCSRFTAHKKLHRLLAEGHVRVLARSSPKALGYSIVALIGIKAPQGKANEIANALAAHKDLQMVAICDGGYDIVITGRFQNSGGLSDFIRHDLGTRLGSLSVEVAVLLDTKKLSLSFFETGRGDSSGPPAS